MMPPKPVEERSGPDFVEGTDEYEEFKERRGEREAKIRATISKFIFENPKCGLQDTKAIIK